MIACCTRRFRRCYSLFSRDACADRFCKSLPLLSVWITKHTCLHSIPLIFLLQDALNCSPLFRESFELTALQFLAREIPLWIIPRTYRVSTHSQLFLCSAKDFEILFDLSKILNSLLFWEFLHTCIPVNSFGLVIYFKNLCDCHSDRFDSTCV